MFCFIYGFKFCFFTEYFLWKNIFIMSFQKNVHLLVFGNFFLLWSQPIKYVASLKVLNASLAIIVNFIAVVLQKFPLYDNVLPSMTSYLRNCILFSSDLYSIISSPVYYNICTLTRVPFKSIWTAHSINRSL